MEAFLFTIWLMWHNTVQFTFSETAHFLIQQDFRAFELLLSVLILIFKTIFEMAKIDRITDPVPCTSTKGYFTVGRALVYLVELRQHQTDLYNPFD